MLNVFDTLFYMVFKFIYFWNIYKMYTYRIKIQSISFFNTRFLIYKYEHLIIRVDYRPLTHWHSKGETLFIDGAIIFTRDYLCFLSQLLRWKQ